MKNFISLRDKLTYQELLEYDYEKNNIKPEEISYGSANKVWWKCRKGHTYKMSANKKHPIKMVAHIVQIKKS